MPTDIFVPIPKFTLFPLLILALAGCSGEEPAKPAQTTPHSVQAQVRDMVMHFRAAWGAERGNSRHLHDIFPMGGPQKQGNRIAGIRKTKGEH